MYEFRFADIGEGIHEGQILKWFFKEGDTVKEGDTLCLVETDKVNAEIPSPVTGKLVKLNFAVGDTVHVGDVLVVIDDGKGEAKPQPVSEDKQAEEQGVIGEIEVSNEVIESSDEAKDETITATTKKVLATPVARKLAKDLGVDITKVKGTGPMGRVMKEDIIRESQAKQETIPAPEVPVARPEVTLPKMEFKDNVERVKITKLRKTIAKNMALSVSVIPHTTSMTEIDVTKLVAFRKTQKEVAQQRNISLTYLPFIVKAVVLTLKEYRMFNASFDQENDEIIYKNFYNIGIAVDTEDGLIVPVIKNADKLGIFDIAREIQELSSKARDRSIGLDKLQDGTFTITNYGAAGLSFGTPIIRYPESAILGIGIIQKKPVVDNDEIVIRDMLPISLSYDHRIIDGGDAGRFLARLREYLSDPMLLLLS